MSRKIILFILALVLGAGIGLALVLVGPGDDGYGLPLVRETEHLEIHTDLDPAALDHHVLVFEGFLRVFEERYFKVEQQRRLRMFLFGDPAAYVDFVKKHFPDHNTPYGFYRSRQNLIVVNLRTGLGTATHELVHHFNRVSFARPPLPWVDEGFATFFEKFMGHLDGEGQLHISFGYFSNWRFPDTRSRLDALGLRKLAAAPRADQGAARSLMLYLHRNGLLVKFIRRVKTGCRSDCLAELSQVTGQDLDQLERNWKAWIAAQTDDRDVKMVPWAFVKTEGEWRAWWERNRSWLTWSDTQQRYVPRERQGPQ